MDAVAFIRDPDVQAVFRAGAENGRLCFRYSTAPASVTYYVFSWLDGSGTWQDAKMTKTELLGRFG